MSFALKLVQRGHEFGHFCPYVHPDDHVDLRSRRLSVSMRSGSIEQCLGSLEPCAELLSYFWYVHGFLPFRAKPHQHNGNKLRSYSDAAMVPLLRTFSESTEPPTSGSL